MTGGPDHDTTSEMLLSVADDFTDLSERERAARCVEKAQVHATLALAATVREAAASITAALQPSSGAPPWLVPASSGTNLSPVRVTRTAGGACTNCGAKPGFKHEPGCVHDGHEHRSDMCVEEGTR